MNFLTDRKFLRFVLKFILIFCVLYYGTKAMIGLAQPGRYYIPFVDHYLDYVSGIKWMLIYSTKGLLFLFGVKTNITPGFIIRFAGGVGVFVSMSCVGYGVYSFWIAFVAANTVPLRNKIRWIVGGLLLLFTINFIRITLFLTALNKGWPMPLGIDHHTWFNIVAYIAIFIMIGWFDKKELRNTNHQLPVKQHPEKNKEVSYNKI